MISICSKILSVALLSGDPVDVLGKKLGATTGGGVPQKLVDEPSVAGNDVELADEGCEEVKGTFNEVVIGESDSDSVEENSVNLLTTSVLASALETLGSSFLLDLPSLETGTESLVEFRASLLLFDSRPFTFLRCTMFFSRFLT